MGHAERVRIGLRALALLGLAIVVLSSAPVSAQTRYVIYYNSAATPLEKVAESGFTDVIL